MIKAEDIMTTEVVTIRGSATVAEAVALMKERHFRSLIVEPRTENDPYGMIGGGKGPQNNVGGAGPASGNKRF